MPVPSTIHASAIPEVNFLVSSVKQPKESKKSFKERSSKFINLIFDLEQKDQKIEKKGPRFDANQKAIDGFLKSNQINLNETF